MTPKPVLRSERVADIGEIHQVVHRAFGRSGEADLVDALRRGNALVLSAVADLDGRIVGHAAFSPITIGERHSGLALAPVAVLPECQRQGLGTATVHWGLDACRSLGHRIVIVLGSPVYYSRFGFTPAYAFGIECPFPAPPDDFMLLELVPGAAAGCRGAVRYRPEFAQL